MKTLLATVASLLLTLHANAAILSLDLRGTAGFGLLAANEPQPLTVASTASGGEFGLGITYDTVTNILDLTNVGWGSSMGFNDLTSASSVAHIHGSTAADNGSGFTQTAGALVTLTRSSNATTGGTFTNPIVDFDTVFGALAESREAELLAGRMYINIHTTSNTGGELRGFIVVPEPSSVGLVALGLMGVGSMRRRKTSAL